MNLAEDGVYAENRLWLAELVCVCVPAGLRTSTGGDVQTPSGSTAQSPSRLIEKALQMCNVVSHLLEFWMNQKDQRKSCAFLKKTLILIPVAKYNSVQLYFF